MILDIRYFLGCWDFSVLGFFAEVEPDPGANPSRRPSPGARPDGRYRSIPDGQIGDLLSDDPSPRKADRPQDRLRNRRSARGLGIQVLLSAASRPTLVNLHVARSLRAGSDFWPRRGHVENFGSVLRGSRVMPPAAASQKQTPMRLLYVHHASRDAYAGSLSRGRLSGPMPDQSSSALVRPFAGQTPAGPHSRG